MKLNMATGLNVTPQIYSVLSVFFSGNSAWDVKKDCVFLLSLPFKMTAFQQDISYVRISDIPWAASGL